MLKAGEKVCYETKNSSSGYSLHFLQVREGSKETPLVHVVRTGNKLYFHTIVNVFCCLHSKIEIGKQKVAIILAALVPGGGRTICRWFNQQNGSVPSLQQHQAVGRPRILQPTDIQQHVGTVVQSHNRHHQSVHYPDLLRPVRAATHTSISLRTLQRYGLETLHIKNKRTKKRTERERKNINIHTLYILSSSSYSFTIVV
jgi:hypothetical protein